MQKLTTNSTYPVIKPCECGCRTLGTRCVRVEDEDGSATPETDRPANGMARYLP
jgi:hypothetical protein